MVNNDSSSSCVKQRESYVGKTCFSCKWESPERFRNKSVCVCAQSMCMCGKVSQDLREKSESEHNQWTKKETNPPTKNLKNFLATKKKFQTLRDVEEKKLFVLFASEIRKFFFFCSLIWFIAKLNWTSICFTNFCFCPNISPKSILVYGTTPCRCQL